MIDDIVPRAEEEAFIAIREAVARVEATREQQFADAERRLVDLAILVARRVIAREVSLDPAVVVGLVREGMAALGERDRVVVRVGTFFRDARDDLQRQLSTSKVRCEVVVDPSLGRAGCVVETDLGRVDESIDARLANLLEALSEGSKRPGAG
jgi:flagellar assembly protein FliH